MSKQRRQLRGQPLRNRIEEVIRSFSKDCQKDGVEYVYNASNVADEVPTTRKTLRKHDDLVESVLSDLQARRRISTGEATSQFLRDKIDLLKHEIEKRDKKIAALRNHHVELYETLHLNSVNGMQLIRPILALESKELGACLLCGSAVSSKTVESNVVTLKRDK